MHELPTQMIRLGGASRGAKGESEGSTREASQCRPGRGSGGGDARHSRTAVSGLRRGRRASPPPAVASEAGLAGQAPAVLPRVREGLASSAPEDVSGVRARGPGLLPDVRPRQPRGGDPGALSAAWREPAPAREGVRRRLGVGAACAPGRSRQRRPGAGRGRPPSTTGKALTTPEMGKPGREDGLYGDFRVRVDVPVLRRADAL